MSKSPSLAIRLSTDDLRRLKMLADYFKNSQTQVVRLLIREKIKSLNIPDVESLVMLNPITARDMDMMTVTKSDKKKILKRIKTRSDV